MTDRNDRIRDAFTDEFMATAWDSDRVLDRVLRHSRYVRRRRVYRRTVWGLVVSLVFVVALQWTAMRAAVPTPVIREAPLTFDSLSSNPAEKPVTTSQAPGEAATAITTRQEMPSNLIPLLGHRSSLTNDIEDLTDRRDDLRAALDAHPGGQREAELRAEISAVDHQIASTRTALNVVDRQLAGIEGTEPVTVYEAVPVAPDMPPVIFRGPLPGEPFLWASGIALTAVLIMFTALLYFRRTMRAATEALTSLQSQASTQLSALTSGIEAIAIEVERLGENQRFMSKVIVGEKETSA